MKKIWSFIKKVLKRFFPATVHILMREVNGLHGAMAAGRPISPISWAWRRRNPSLS